MIRQAHTYMVGAMSGATLIAIAIAVFVMLVTAQVFRDWPLAALGDGGGASGVSDARAITTPAAGGAGSAALGSASPAQAGGQAVGKSAGGQADLASAQGGNGVSGGQAGDQVGGGPATGTGGSGATGGSGGQGGSGAASPAPGQSSPGSSPGTTSPGSPGSGGGGGAGGGGAGSGSASTPSGQVTETVNSTVGKVDETALGETLGETGVTKVTEGVVNGVAGPESTVGHVVDETVDALGGLLHGHG